MGKRVATRRGGPKLDTKQGNGTTRMVGSAVEIVTPGLMVPFEAYHELVKELAALKRDGFTASPTYDAPIVAPELPPEIVTALNGLGAEGTLRRHLMAQATDLLRGGMEATEVAGRLVNGEPIEL